MLPPFLFLPGALDVFRLPQRLLAEWLALASLLALVPALPLARWRDLMRRPAALAVLPLLVVAALGLVFTDHPAHAADALADLAIGAAALLGWSLALPVATLRRLLDLVLIPAAGLSLLAILQLHGLWRPLVFSGDVDGRLGVTSLAGNPGDLAALLVLPCLVAQAGLASAAGAGRWWRGAILCLALYALAGTQTFTSLAAVVAGSVVLWASMLPRRRLLLAAASPALVAVLLVALVGPLRERLAVQWQLIADRHDVNTLLSGRLDGWRVAVRLLGEHPFAGVGLGAYRAEFPSAKLRLLHEGVPFFAGHMSPSFANAHNEVLEVGAELGWPGLLALAWGMVLVGRGIRRVGRRSVLADRALARSGLLALALLAAAYFPLRLAPVAFPWLAWLAWLFAGDAEEPSP